MSSTFSRRRLLSLGGAGTLLGTIATTGTGLASASPVAGSFLHGVASGDPGLTSVVLWSRVSPTASRQPGMVRWTVAKDSKMQDVVSTGQIVTGPYRDWTAKALIDGLQPGQTFYYQFKTLDNASPVGRTRTLPAGDVDKARFAVVSCSNYSSGFFNVYDAIARQDDLDAVLHLGDYIYEYGGKAGEDIGRKHLPEHEILTLEDYRQRHAQHKQDPASQAMHRKHPLIPIWDDHEVADNSWKGGANNHQAKEEGNWDERRGAALQAYYEWMPVREPATPPEAFYRSFSYGTLLHLSALETRLMARDEQISYSAMRALQSSEEVAAFERDILWKDDREMLGAEQMRFLRREWDASALTGHSWRLIANQVLMANVTTPDLNDRFDAQEIDQMTEKWSGAQSFVDFSAYRLPIAPDSWSGYPAARDRFYQLAREFDSGVVVLTGDTHAWWANDLIDANGSNVGVELGVHSVTASAAFSPGSYGGKGSEYAQSLIADNRGVRFVSGEGHGYIDLTVTPDTVEAIFKTVSTVKSPEYQVSDYAEFKVRQNGGVSSFVDDM
ncbi:alkaline phosphatase [Parvularcula flava]|uniref:Alkaline phosphatase n=1 Tax=Aquisalinus luteolus TaxID=1566827 RepID=A0A8J3A4J7_9PROT|nr:alkaline phosphatase D family protein [Aquisalinus luteolus]NHK29667.1 alkaline phosphatase [Aquisalinus luteolus]GGI02163.1 alkaline phosphatase [Aquisalinus luteolus]